MRINYKINTAEEVSTFLCQHSRETSALLLGKGAECLEERNSLLGYPPIGAVTVEDFFNITANPEHAKQKFVHIKFATQEGTPVGEAVEEILGKIKWLEQYIFGWDVQAEPKLDKDKNTIVDEDGLPELIHVLGSFKSGMIAGVVFHGETAIGRKTPHGHLIVIPRTMTREGDKFISHQLDAKRLVRSIKKLSTI